MTYTYPTRDAYLAAQYRANAEKIGTTWARAANIYAVADRVQQLIGAAPRFGLCHGTRNGFEQAMFAELLPGCEVLGTEIAPTAAQFPRTIQWDFHDLRPEWSGVADFVYSNSLDHAMDPRRAVSNWLRSLRPPLGVLVIEWGSEHEQSSETDPYGATLPELLALIAECGGEVVAVDDARERPERVSYLKLVYVRHRAIDDDMVPEAVRRIPSMGGREIGRDLREWAAACPDGSAIVELGCWLGAGTAQMALGVRHSGRSVVVHAYDAFEASAGEVAKAAAHGVRLRDGQDTSGRVFETLHEIGALVTLHKGDIRKARYAGPPISLHVDDCCKRNYLFLPALRTFGPHWIAGQTVVVLMDFWYFERPGVDRALRFQHDWMAEHAGCFEVIRERMPGTSAAAWRYVGGEPWLR
ncbi:MAG TPA: hypothetical protein VFH17_08260 [Coriobacteriia bacterium]|nr:hypothetical protein [Coriobacteriia bacterium]